MPGEKLLLAAEAICGVDVAVHAESNQLMEQTLSQGRC